jgi:hypothetical protein
MGCCVSMPALGGVSGADKNALPANTHTDGHAKAVEHAAGGGGTHGAMGALAGLTGPSELLSYSVLIPRSCSHHPV